LLSQSYCWNKGHSDEPNSWSYSLSACLFCAIFHLAIQTLFLLGFYHCFTKFTSMFKVNFCSYHPLLSYCNYQSKDISFYLPCSIKLNLGGLEPVCLQSNGLRGKSRLSWFFQKIRTDSMLSIGFIRKEIALTGKKILFCKEF